MSDSERQTLRRDLVTAWVRCSESDAREIAGSLGSDQLLIQQQDMFRIAPVGMLSFYAPVRVIA